jgi:DNA modification methylase
MNVAKATKKTKATETDTSAPEAPITIGKEGDVAAVMVAVDKLLPWVKNPRRIPNAAVRDVAKSIRRFGFGAPLIARLENGEIIGGHTRIMAARSLGLDVVPVRYLPLTEDDAHALAIADNKLGELTGWDNGTLGDILNDFAKRNISLDGLGFGSADLHRLIRGSTGNAGDDDVPAAPKVAVTKLGDVYELGPHRLVCGDSRDPAAWKALLVETHVDMVWTDPPYGVAYVGKTKDALTIENDALDEAELETFLRAALGAANQAAKPGAAWYVAAPGGPLFHVFGTVLRELKVWRQTLTWLKDSMVLGRSDYHYKTEPVFYGWKPGAGHFFVDDRTQDTVWEIPRPKVSVEHPTMKPIELVARAIRNSSRPGEVVVDPFGGSGTTLIAAHHEDRRARLIELSPNYVDVIIARWEALSGLKAKRVVEGSGA